MLEDLLLEYVRMRKQGMPVTDALKALKPYVGALKADEREELSRKLRAWENQKMDLDYSKPDTKSIPEEISAMTHKAAEAELSPEHWIECPNCGKKNRLEEYFCFKCGYLLGGFGDKMDTKLFVSATSELHDTAYFGAESVLIIRAKGVSGRIELHPPNHERDLVIGRSDNKSEFKPDVDLKEIGGLELGVSRLHLGICYSTNDSVIEIYDLGSANGTRLNNQKLRPNERRVLRNGDELRLGRCVLYITYVHPGEAL